MNEIEEYIELHKNGLFPYACSALWNKLLSELREDYSQELELGWIEIDNLQNLLYSESIEEYNEKLKKLEETIDYFIKN